MSKKLSNLQAEENKQEKKTVFYNDESEYIKKQYKEIETLYAAPDERTALKFSDFIEDIHIYQEAARDFNYINGNYDFNLYDKFEAWTESEGFNNFAEPSRLAECIYNMECEINNTLTDYEIMTEEAKKKVFTAGRLLGLTDEKIKICIDYIYDRHY